MPLMDRVADRKSNLISEDAPRTVWVAYCHRCCSTLTDLHVDPTYVDVELSCAWCGAEEVELQDVTR